MTDDERDGMEWNEAERRAFASLEREALPPAGVEGLDRLVVHFVERPVLIELGQNLVLTHSEIPPVGVG